MTKALGLRKGFQMVNSFFDQIYVLTLQRAHDRHDHVRRAFNGLNYRFIYGVDKHSLSMDNMVQMGIFDPKLHLQTKRTHRCMNLGEVACALSHRNIYQDIVDRGYRRTLILEDDVAPVGENLLKFQAAMLELPQDWELVMLGYYGEKPPQLLHHLQKKIYRVYQQLRWFNWHKVSTAWIDQMCLKPVNERFWEMGKLVGGHAYGLTLQTARRFIDFQTPIKLQADRVFYYHKVAYGLKAYVPRNRMFTLSNLSQTSYIGYGKVLGNGFS